MPDIDVTDVLISLGVADQEFSVVRRVETVNTYGESVQTDTVLGPYAGAVQPLGDRSLFREETFSTGKNGISVWSPVTLYNAARAADGTTYQPDLVLWKGDYYLVRGVDDWTQFGQGYVRADCVGYDYVQTPE